MCSDFIIRKKLARVSPEGLPAIRLIGLKECDDEKFKRAVEHRFSSGEAYRSVLRQDLTALTEEEQKKLIRSLLHVEQLFEYRRYPDNPNWFDVIPQKLPAGVLKEYVPASWYKILVAVSHDLGYPA